MNQQEIIQRGIEIAKQYGYPIPTIVFSDRMYRSNGYCWTSRKHIQLSAKFCEYSTPQDIENLLKHEIVHLRIRGHDWNFQKACLAMGVNNGFEQSKTNTEAGKKVYEEKAKVEYQCPTCKQISKYIRIKKYDISCGKCSGGKFNPQFLMVRIK